MIYFNKEKAARKRIYCLRSVNSPDRSGKKAGLSRSGRQGESGPELQRMTSKVETPEIR